MRLVYGFSDSKLSTASATDSKRSPRSAPRRVGATSRTARSRGRRANNRTFRLRRQSGEPRISQRNRNGVRGQRDAGHHIGFQPARWYSASHCAASKNVFHLLSILASCAILFQEKKIYPAKTPCHFDPFEA